MVTYWLVMVTTESYLSVQNGDLSVHQYQELPRRNCFRHAINHHYQFIVAHVPRVSEVNQAQLHYKCLVVYRNYDWFIDIGSTTCQDSHDISDLQMQALPATGCVFSLHYFWSCWNTAVDDATPQGRAPTLKNRAPLLDEILYNMTHSSLGPTSLIGRHVLSKTAEPHASNCVPRTCEAQFLQWFCHHLCWDLGPEGPSWVPVQRQPPVATRQPMNRTWALQGFVLTERV